MRKAWLLFSQTVTVAVAILFVVSTLQPTWLPWRQQAAAPAATIVPLPAPVQNVSILGNPNAPTSYSDAAKRAPVASASEAVRRSKGWVPERSS